MGLCKDCFHREVCESWTTINLDDIPPEIPCGHFKDTDDVAPRAEWISVKERLPDCEQGAESEAVLFITKQGFMYTGYFGCGGIYHDRYFREYKNSTEGYDISNVTHWMPLPEPPDMKGGE